MRKAQALLIAAVILLSAPLQATAAIHFGGQIQTMIYCLGEPKIYTLLGPPRGGEYIWHPQHTDTYSFGPPRHIGQWLLGNAGPSSFCIESIIPLIVKSGWLIMTMGSSQ